MKFSHRQGDPWLFWLIRIAIGLGLGILSIVWLLPLAYAQRGYRAFGWEILLILFVFLLPLFIPSLRK